MTVTRIAELSSIIAANTAHIDTYLTSRGLPSPSFDADVAPGLFATDCLAAARHAVLEATYELHGLMQGPLSLLMDHAVCADFGYLVTMQWTDTGAPTAQFHDQPSSHL